MKSTSPEELVTKVLEMRNPIGAIAQLATELASGTEQVALKKLVGDLLWDWSNVLDAIYKEWPETRSIEAKIEKDIFGS